MGEPKGFLLPRDMLEAQLSQVELIRAMYPDPDQTDTERSIDEAIERARVLCSSSDPPEALDVPSDLSLIVTIPLDVGAMQCPPCVQLSVSVPLRCSGEDPSEPPPLSYSIRQPAWMSRAEVAELAAALPPNDVLAAFDYLQENAPRYHGTKATGPEPAEQGPSPLLRVWFYFPSLSTREKRRDLVTYAPSYQLTGFVLAGKPGVLCLEGTSRDIDGYMSAIKNQSWGDIPSHHKKVSERYREDCGEGGRKFDDMREITDDLGEKKGARRNRGDMAVLEAWLRDRGVGEAFERVVLGA